MVIKVLCENTVGYDGSENCLSEWGLSLYIETNNLKLILDSGQSDIFLRNAQSLNIDIDNIDLIALSHHHFDHVNGLKYFPSKNKKDLLLHSDLLNKLDVTYSQYIKDNFNIIETDSIYKIDQNIYFLGTIPSITNFEKGYYKADDVIDNMSDDSALVYDTDNGIIIISGCSHSGICNICEYARKHFNKRIRGVIGGFHLFKDDVEAIQGTVNYFKDIKPDFLYPMHCVDFQTLVTLENELGIRKFSTGDTIHIPD